MQDKDQRRQPEVKRQSVEVDCRQDRRGEADAMRENLRAVGQAMEERECEDHRKSRDKEFLQPF